MPSGDDWAVYQTCKPLLLASTSARRRAYLRDLGLKFSIQAPEVAETVLPGEVPREYVERMARIKVQAVMACEPCAWIVAGDTVVCLEREIFGKPQDAIEAVAMLMRLSGKTHTVYSAIAVGCATEHATTVRSVATEVTFTPFSEEVAACYVAQGESFDKAGAYGIQGKGAFLVERIHGSYSNVVGLPLAELITVLIAHGVIKPCAHILE